MQPKQSSEWRRTLTLLTPLLLLLLASPSPAADPAADFSRDIQPILSEYCYQCHGPDAGSRKARLRLDLESVTHSGTIIVPGNSAGSELVKRIFSTDPDEQMPPPTLKRPLAPAQIEALKRWIDQGAPWGRHWAFEPLSRPTPPPINNTTWPRNPIDQFVGARLEEAGLQPSPEAGKTTLIRRLSLDLTGLPPTPEEIAAFLSDNNSNAFEKLVDRLLASHHFGERMAWDWLEAARYADSNGYQGDSERTMWPWRDWVVQAFNDNLGFDSFTLWQIAGDLLPNASLEQKIATGFNRNHPINGEGGRIPEENRIDYVMDMAETCGTTWLGLTLNCCRCHDHKFDALSQTDYYQFFAFFNNTPVDGGGGDPRTPPNIAVPSEEQSLQLTSLKSRQTRAAGTVREFEHTLLTPPANEPPSQSTPARDIPAEILELLTVPPEKRNIDQWKKLAGHWKERKPAYHDLLRDSLAHTESIDNLRKQFPRVMIMEEREQPRKTSLLNKGLYDKPVREVGIGVPSSLPQLPADAPKNRLGLAQWLVARENPLTARVIVNRFWQQFFGIGLVKTPEDLGVQGEKPSHPGLHDWLASEFVDSGWNVKQLCKQIVMSATYRQSSRSSESLQSLDPANRLLARGARFRMPSWMIRDQALTAAGLLSPRLGGTPVNPYQPPGVWAEATFGNKRYSQDHGESLYRRSLYTFWRRIVGPTLFFDTADRSTCTVKQPRTNTPLHALTTLNDITYVEAARVMAQRVLTHSTNTTHRIQYASTLVLSRPPTPAELDILTHGLERNHQQFQADPKAATQLLAVGESKPGPHLNPAEHAAYTLLCSTLLNLDEALTKE